MKKHFLFVLLTMLMALLVCACTTAPNPDPGQINDEPEVPAPRSTVRLTMATGATSGAYYPYGGTLALAIGAATGYIKINVNSTGSYTENLQQIAGGLADLAIVQNDVMSYAYNGDNIWTTEPIKDMATLMSLYPEACQLIVTAESDITSVADLKNKRISTGDAGSGVEANAIQILNAYGLTIDDLAVEHLGLSASIDAIKEQSIDGFFITSGVPNAAVMGICTFCDIRVIGLDDDKIEELITKYPFFTKATISEKEYGFITESINTVAVQATLTASLGLDEQVAYDIVKSIIESKEGIMVAHAKGAYIDPNYAVQGVSVDLHPGAKKYFQEIGVLQP